MQEGTNLERVRDYNQGVVLEAIRLGDGISRVEIADRAASPRRPSPTRTHKALKGRTRRWPTGTHCREARRDRVMLLGQRGIVEHSGDVHNPMLSLDTEMQPLPCAEL